jgi:hypothetical protein
MTKEEKEFQLSLFTHFSAEALAEAVERETRYIRSFRRRSRELRREKADYIAEFERVGWPPKSSTLRAYDEDIHEAEAEVRGAREALALYRRAQELQAIHGRRDNDNMYPISL